MIAETLIILFVIAIHKRYSFENLNYLPSKAIGFLIGFVAIKIAVFVCAKLGANFDILRFFSFFSHILLFAFLFYNRNYKGVKTILIGSVLNWIVMYLNGFKMPISGKFYSQIVSNNVFNRTLMGESLHHTIINPTTKAVFLGDIIPLIRPYPFPKLISIGDILIAVGFIIMGIYVLKGEKNEE